MRRFALPCLVALAVLAAGGAAAEPLVVRIRPEPATNEPPGQAWQPERPLPILHQQPVGQLIGARLGIVHGSAELFRFRVENAAPNHAMLDGVIDGGGIKLKLTW